MNTSFSHAKSATKQKVLKIYEQPLDDDDGEE
jgi:hypothetical protein